MDVGKGVPFDLQIAHFVSVIRGQEPPRCTPETALAAVTVCEAVKRALHTQVPVDIEPYEL